MGSELGIDRLFPICNDSRVFPAAMFPQPAIWPLLVVAVVYVDYVAVFPIGIVASSRAATEVAVRDELRGLRVFANMARVARLGGYRSNAHAKHQAIQASEPT